MSTINFVVRNGAGNLQRGVVGDGVAPLVVGAGNDISLNVTRSQIVAYSRHGAALHVTLSDGSVVVLEGFFGPDGNPQNDLFISDDGLLSKVALTADSDGRLFGTYAEQDVFGKWSPDDDLYFVRGEDPVVAQAYVPVDDEVGMLAPAFLGAGLGPLGWLAAGLGAAAVAGGNGSGGGGGGGGDGGGDGGDGGGDGGLTVTVLTGTKDAGHVVNAEDHSDGVEITGTGTPGADVTVEINGKSETTVVAEDGTWGVVFDPTEVDPGTYETGVVVTITDGTDTVVIEDVLVVDTEAFVTFDAEAVGGDGTVNGVEASGGTLLTGTTEPGSVVTVVVAGKTYTAVVVGGEWSVTIPADDMAAGEYALDVSVTAVDVHGNTATTEGTFQVDTSTFVTINSDTIGGDGMVNGTEHAGGVTITGTAQAGASVVVTVGAVSHTVTAAADGTWSALFATGEIADGTYLSSVTAVATDAAGNTASANGTFQVDTSTFVTVEAATVEADGVVNFDERSDGVTLTGTAEAGATVTVTMAGVTRVVTATAAGTWSATWAASEVPSGETTAAISVSAVDAAGNTASTSGSVVIDTLVNRLTLDDMPGGADEIVNNAESGQPIVLSGQVEAGSSVIVTLAGIAQAATVDAAGNWTVTYAANTLPTGTLSTQLVVRATDAAGNTASLTETVQIDTEVMPLTLDKPIEGDNIINMVEAADGVVLSGTVEAGSVVQVTFGGTVRTVTAGVDGLWSAVFPASSMASGEYNQSIEVRATDLAGNVRSINDTVRVDTIVNRLTMTTPVEGDNIVNRAEASDGITLTGTVEAGSTVSVTFEGVTRTATVTSSGNWSVTYGAHEVPAGEYTTTVTINATDAVGNTRAMTETFAVDTTPPEAPLIESYTRSGPGVRGLTTSLTEDTVEIAQIDGSGKVSAVDYTVSEDTYYNELDFSFRTPIANGSHLVITASDDAGNSTSTLFVLEETLTNVVDLGNQGLGVFDIEAIDLQFAEDSVLTLTASDLHALCAHSNTLTIHGGADDTVNILGATATGDTTEIGGRIYNIYAMGDQGGSLIIDDEIHVMT